MLCGNSRALGHRRRRPEPATIPSLADHCFPKACRGRPASQGRTFVPAHALDGDSRCRRARSARSAGLPSPVIPRHLATPVRDPPGPARHGARSAPDPDPAWLAGGSPAAMMKTDRAISREQPDALTGASAYQGPAMVLYGASDIFADGTEIVRSRHPAGHPGDLARFWSRALASEPVRLCRCARRILRTRTRLSRAARSSGDRPSAQIGPVMRAAFGARRIAVSVSNGGYGRCHARTSRYLV